MLQFVFEIFYVRFIVTEVCTFTGTYFLKIQKSHYNFSMLHLTCINWVFSEVKLICRTR